MGPIVHKSSHVYCLAVVMGMENIQLLSEVFTSISYNKVLEYFKEVIRQY